MLILLALVLIALVTFTYFDAMMPALGWRPLSMEWLSCTSLGIWILINIVINYGASILVSPIYHGERAPGKVGCTEGPCCGLGNLLICAWVSLFGSPMGTVAGAGSKGPVTSALAANGTISLPLPLMGAATRTLQLL